LNAVRRSVATAAVLPDVTASGPDLLRAIMEEKYIALFQNIEIWNDYKRTCLPNLRPVTGLKIPGRFFYGVTERQTNPNIPEAGDQPFRNDNDPANAGCLGQ
jgi:hypothetical protein